MAQNENFGIMDQGYFVPRSEIISWVNDLLKINLTKIEELGSGAVYCQILDVIYPGKVAMNKVNWKAKVDYEFLNNYKVLQNGFDKFGIKRYIDVERLSKAKYQDNLQFIQWLKRYYEVNCNDKSAPYNPDERRGSVKIDFTFAEKIVVPKSFNAGGQIIPKTRINSKEKRSQAASGQKESVKRLASPQNIPKLKPISQQKKQPVIDRKESNKDLRKVQGLNALNHLPPNPHQKAGKPQQKPQLSEESISIRPNRGSIEQLQAYKKKVRDLQSKLEMIAEIAQTKDDAEIKMKLIEEVLSIGSSKLSKVSQFEVNQSGAIKSILPKSEEAKVADSTPVSEQAPQNQIFTFQVSKQVSEKSSKLQNASERMENDSKIVVADEQQQVF